MEEYNWNLILKAAVPFSIIEAYLFYIKKTSPFLGIDDFWKWLSLIVALLLTGAIVYIKSRKKNNIFTAVGIVFLAALIVRFMKNFGFL